jgi:AraC-like DNA-binding protein
VADWGAAQHTAAGAAPACTRLSRHVANPPTVTAMALAVGYESTRAFVAAFRRAAGTTPGRYFTSRDDPTNESHETH